ncbi:hypothetical protein AWB68_08812 [Caballeronia choica]|uniref:Secreted protein n=1 Tax=Caballeronia choica TaxID=326476 RepID=A0A158L5B6_9BURK|nr:hypothetical protein AWB68_08812 [Caballeronia choica]
MFSWPPAITMSASPAMIALAASITAFRPEPQTLLIVMPGTADGSPALMSDWRAGFWPDPAVSTWPRITSLICSGFRFARSSTARITAAPRSGAAIFASDPPNLPTAVRAADTITTSVISTPLCRQQSLHLTHYSIISNIACIARAFLTRKPAVARAVPIFACAHGFVPKLFLAAHARSQIRREERQRVAGRTA